MSDLSPEVQSLLKVMAKQPGVTQEQVNQVEVQIVNSPFLADIMTRAARNHDLKGIALSDNPNEAGHYSRDTGFIHLAPETISGSGRRLGQQADYLTVTLGHETGHALRAQIARQELSRFSQTVDLTLQEAVNSESYVDLTAPTKRYLVEARHNESLAEMAGLNALADRVRSDNDGVLEPAELARRAVGTTSCVDVAEASPTLAAGLKLNASGFQNPKDPAAVEAIATCFYDRSGSLGRHGDMGYQNYNGGPAIEIIAQHWRDTDRYARSTNKTAPEVHLNMAELGLDAKLIEHNGLKLDGKPFGFIDTSHGQMQLATVRPGTPAASPQHPRADVADQALEPRADRPGHPDHNAFEAIRTTVRADGRWDDRQSENIAAALLREHKADPLSQRLDGVVVGPPTAQGDTNVFAVYAPHGLNREPQFLATVDAGKAAQEPAAQNLDQVNQLNQQQALQQSQSQTQQMGTQGPGGPRM